MAVHPKTQDRMAHTINQYEVLLASKDTMLDKYAKALDDKNNTIKHLQSLLAMREHEINTLKEERILSMMMPIDDYSSMPVVKTEELIDNEFSGGIDSVVHAEYQTVKKSSAQIGEVPILTDIPPGSTDRIWNQVVNNGLGTKIIKVIKPTKELIHRDSNHTEEHENWIQSQPAIIENHSSAIDTTGNTMNKIVSTEVTPMEMVWRDGSLEVVDTSLKEEFDFSENIMDDHLDTINFETNEVQFQEQETRIKSIIDTKQLFRQEPNKNFEKQVFQLPITCLYTNCSRIFQDGYNYKKHMKNTHGPKIFVCSECSRGFKENSKLVRHKLVHTGERRFRCPFDTCGQMFTLEFNVRTHMRIHTGERPYRCNVVGCRKTFVQQSNMKSHIETSHIEYARKVWGEDIKAFQ